MEVVKNQMALEEGKEGQMVLPMHVQVLTAQFVDHVPGHVC